MSEFFLVVGSPSLLGHPWGRAWAELLLQRCFNEADSQSVVVTGGAEGPERWAIEQAEACGLHWVVYSRDGLRHGSREHDPRKPPQRWSPSEATVEGHHEALLEAAQGARREGREVRVVALLWGEEREPCELLDKARLAGFKIEQRVVRDAHEPAALLLWGR